MLIGQFSRSQDEVLTTDHEHPGGMYCWLYLAKHQRVRVRQIHLPTPATNKEEILQLVEDNRIPVRGVHPIDVAALVVAGLEAPVVLLGSHLDDCLDDSSANGFVS